VQPGRLERHWDYIRPQILKHWDRLTEYDLSSVAGRFDRLVGVIRQAYFPARSSLSIEADIRDWVVSRITEIENYSAKEGV